MVLDATVALPELLEHNAKAQLGRCLCVLPARGPGDRQALVVKVGRLLDQPVALKVVADPLERVEGPRGVVPLQGLVGRGQVRVQRRDVLRGKLWDALVPLRVDPPRLWPAIVASLVGSSGRAAQGLSTRTSSSSSDGRTRSSSLRWVR